MSSSEIFKAAHKMTKAAMQDGDSYAVTFGSALIEVYKSLKSKLENAMRTMQQTVAAIIEAAKAKGHEVSEEFNGSETYIDIEQDGFGNYAEAVVYKDGTHNVAFGRGKIADIIKAI